MLNPVTTIDIKAIFEKYRAKERASAALSRKQITNKYQKRPRANEDAPVAKESEPLQPQWFRIKKGLPNPKVHSPSVP